MINGNENLFSSRIKSLKCSICQSENVSISFEKIKDNKIKNILDKMDKNQLINKCNCSNNDNNVHKVCLLLNIIYNFDIQCRQCKFIYNINVDKRINKSKKLCKIFLYLFLTLFHIIIFACSVFLILYEFINLFLIIISYSHFIDKNTNNIYDYSINIINENEKTKINKESDKYYSLLIEFYRYFHGTRIRYLMNQKHKSLFFASGYGNFNKEIKNMIQDSNKTIEENDKLSLNKEINDYNIKHNDNNQFHYTGTLGDLKNKKKEDYKNIEFISEDKNSKNTNPINLQISLIKKEYEEDNSHKENMDDILIFQNNLKNPKEKKGENISFNSVSNFSNKKYKLVPKSCIYKKLDQKKLLLKSRTYRTKSDRRNQKKENENEIQMNVNKNNQKRITINENSVEKIYVDSTFLLKNESNKEKEKEKGNA